MDNICTLFGVFRQAFYDAQKQEQKASVAEMIVLCLVQEIRTIMPMIGTRKLLYELQFPLKGHGIKMGRDQLFELLWFNGLLIRKSRIYVQTTNPYHWLKKYPNHAEHLILNASEQLWVSDITYIRTLQGFNYLSLITDAYSRKIVGYCLYPTLESVGCIPALEMAIISRNKDSKLMHHSDRGIQYCLYNYVQILRMNLITISMTQSGSPYENALAESVNGIIKNEFSPMQIYQNHDEVKTLFA